MHRGDIELVHMIGVEQDATRRRAYTADTTGSNATTRRLSTTLLALSTTGSERSDLAFPARLNMLLVRHQPATNRVRDQHSGQVTIARAGDTSKDSTTDSGDATARPAAPWGAVGGGVRWHRPDSTRGSAKLSHS